MATEATTATRADLHALVDALPASALTQAWQLLIDSPAVDPALRTALLAPIDDEPLTDEDIAAIEEAKAGMARGEWVSDGELDELLERAGERAGNRAGSAGRVPRRPRWPS